MCTSGTLAPRFQWAIELIGKGPKDRILEVGFGDGSVLEALCRMLPHAHVYGVEKSAAAVGKAQRRLQSYLQAGLTTLVHGPIERAFLPMTFNQALAVNVNLFWQKAEPALTVLASLLVPGGKLVLVYEQPSASQLARAVQVSMANLTQAAWTEPTASYRKIGSHDIAAITATYAAT